MVGSVTAQAKGSLCPRPATSTRPLSLANWSWLLYMCTCECDCVYVCVCVQLLYVLAMFMLLHPFLSRVLRFALLFFVLSFCFRDSLHATSTTTTTTTITTARFAILPCARQSCSRADNQACSTAPLQGQCKVSSAIATLRPWQWFWRCRRHFPARWSLSILRLLLLSSSNWGRLAFNVCTATIMAIHMYIWTHSSVLEAWMCVCVCMFACAYPSSNILTFPCGRLSQFNLFFMLLSSLPQRQRWLRRRLRQRLANVT